MGHIGVLRPEQLTQLADQRGLPRPSHAIPRDHRHVLALPRVERLAEPLLLVRAIREVMGDYRRVIAEWSLKHGLPPPEGRVPPQLRRRPSGHLAPPPDSASRRQATDAHPIHSAKPAC